MSALDWAANILVHLKKYAELGKICVQDVGRFEECAQVWTVIGIVLGVVCVAALLYIGRHFYREYAAYRRVRRKRMEEMQVAPPEVMNEFVWSGDNMPGDELTQEQIIQRIKEAKARLHANTAAKEKPAGDPTLGSGVRNR